MTPEEFFSVLASMPEPVVPIYRLYHDEQGRVLFYSMDEHPGLWVAVDAATYAVASHDVCVIQGKVTPVPKKTLIQKLRPSAHGVTCDPRDICIVVGADQPHVKWSIA